MVVSVASEGSDRFFCATWTAVLRDLVVETCERASVVALSGLATTFAAVAGARNHPIWRIIEKAGRTYYQTALAFAVGAEVAVVGFGTQARI